jgi:hypothetical protein
VLLKDRGMSFRRFWTFVKSPSCAALKIRCLKRHTSSSTLAQSMLFQSSLQGEPAWTAYQAERRQRGETDEDPFEAYNPFRQDR